MRLRGLLIVLTGLTLLAAFATAASAQEYTFTKVADSDEDGFAAEEFGCSAINNRGVIAFRAGRVAPDGFNTTPGIYRVTRNGSLITIVENERRFDFLSRSPGLNDRGHVSFAATLDRGGEAVFRGSRSGLTPIARTAKEFNFFGFNTSLNNDGRVAFKAELDNFDEGLFSGRAGRVTTHYLASTSHFDGNFSRPSINNVGNIAFEERRSGVQGIFVTSDGGFTTIAEAQQPNGFVGDPALNDAGTVAFVEAFDDEQGNQVFAIQTGNGGPLTTIVDTRGEFAFFDLRAPAFNNLGDIAFFGELDSDTFPPPSGIFVGPDPVEDRVIGAGDTLDGETVTAVGICEDGLNDSGQLAFTAIFEDPNTFERRVAVFRATPGA